MQREAPPFRADHVGSLLRPAALKEGRAKRERGEITDSALRAVEDREIAQAIRKQEEVGLTLATDGELRRSWWQFDFFKGLNGVELYQVRRRHRLPRRQDQARECARDRPRLILRASAHR